MKKFKLNSVQRILAYVTIVIIFGLLISSLLYGRVGIDEILLAFNNVWLWLLPAIVVDTFSINRKWNSIGIGCNIATSKCILLGAVLAAVSVLVMRLLMYVLDTSNTLNASIPSNTYWILNDAAVEELIFRAYIFQAIYKRYPNKYVIIISALLFAGSHFITSAFDAIWFLNIFIFGLLLTTMYIRNGLLITIAFHCIWNWSEIFLFGNMLVESSIICTIILSLLTLAAYKITKLNKKTII